MPDIYNQQKIDKRGQQGPRTVDVLGYPKPKHVKDEANQAETGVGWANNMELNEMPAFSFEQNKQGETKDLDINKAAALSKPLRQRYDVNPANPEANMRMEYIKPDTFDSPGAFK